jgi:hypothetical protein
MTEFQSYTDLATQLFSRSPKDYDMLERGVTLHTPIYDLYATRRPDGISIFLSDPKHQHEGSFYSATLKDEIMGLDMRNGMIVQRDLKPHQLFDNFIKVLKPEKILAHWVSAPIDTSRNVLELKASMRSRGLEPDSILSSPNLIREHYTTIAGLVIKDTWTGRNASRNHFNVVSDIQTFDDSKQVIRQGENVYPEAIEVMIER